LSRWGIVCSVSGLTFLLLPGILSLPWSELASLPPELDVPLPLGPAFIPLPVVGEVPGVAELAAGSPVVAPRPLGTWVWALATPAESTKAATRATAGWFMTGSFPATRQSPPSA
jgi:hypothetical protein